MSVSPPMSLAGKVLRKRWELGAMVGRGACSDVYEVTDIRGEGRSGGEAQAYVAKIAPLPPVAPRRTKAGKGSKLTKKEEKAMRTNADMIYYEYMLYQGFLRGHGGIAEVCMCGTWSGHV